MNAGIGLLAIIISLASAMLIAGNISGGAAASIKPFVSGYINARYEEEILDNMGLDSFSAQDAISEKPELMGEYARECMLVFGFDEKRVEHLAPQAAEIYDSDGMPPTEAAAFMVCTAMAHAVSVILVFIIIMLFISFIKQFFELNFRIQDNADIDLYGGAALGFAQGFIYCTFVCWLLSFCGIIIGKTTLDDGLFSRFFLLIGSVFDIAI